MQFRVPRSFIRLFLIFVILSLYVNFTSGAKGNTKSKPSSRRWDPYQYRRNRQSLSRSRDSYYSRNRYSNRRQSASQGRNWQSDQGTARNGQSALPNSGSVAQNSRTGSDRRTDPRYSNRASYTPTQRNQRQYRGYACSLFSHVF